MCAPPIGSPGKRRWHTRSLRSLIDYRGRRRRHRLQICASGLPVCSMYLVSFPDG
ncbi:hypothetical protein BDY21DRAFT_349255 [Lineolata rhizophorae]|uniref:Uncharacterized protein n=1 Tax=Lineolata rhizophorae TaxID=578093 RepID=A0A6A6NWM8_9PEZI|nr:hypothetical protein BDY21DRAFT_349255 [Lineolata rhizophorae]